MPRAKIVLSACAAAMGAAALLVVGCAGPTSESRRAVNGFISRQDYAGAEGYLDSIKQSQYGEKNAVLFDLDKGALLNEDGKYEESNEVLADAQQRMDDLYTTSVTKAGGMLLLNDNTMDYAGEPYERALTNVFRALNYVFLRQPDDALVESRKVELFLDSLKDEMGDRRVYKDDAFARYLDAMLYADEGMMDDARISLNDARQAYAQYAADYGTPQPRFDFPRRRDKNDGELVFIHYNGVAPRKINETFQVDWNQASIVVHQNSDEDASAAQVKNALNAGFKGDAVTVAYPAYVQDPYSIASSEVWVDSRPVGSTILMEDVSAIAAKTLQDRMSAIKARAIARATIKYIIAETVYRAAAKVCDNEFGSMSIQGAICQGAAKAVDAAAMAATEIADTRSWSTLPAQIRMARVKVPAGMHDVQIFFKDATGAVVATKLFPGVVITAKKRTYLAYRTAQ